jgi:hypothetical protein
MVDNAVSFFYLGKPSSAIHAPRMLHSLSIQSWEIILANLWQPASLTLGILKSLYPWANLDAAGEGFAMTCTNKEALKLVENSAVIVGQVVDMLGVDMSLG